MSRPDLIRLDETLPAVSRDACPVVFYLVSTWDPDFVAAIRRHYTRSRGAPPGKKLAWKIVEVNDLRTVGWIGLGEPPFKLAARRRLGLGDARPLPRTVCCFIYRLEGDRRATAHAILRDWHPVALHDWRVRYGWEPVHWETLVGAAEVREKENPDACFRRAGYRKLGMTTGRTARRPPGSTHGPRVWGDSTPKLVFYRGPLSRVSAPKESAA